MAIAISFFSGAGGLDLGMHRAGFDVRFSAELEPVFCNTLKTNCPELNVIQGNIMDYDKNKIYSEANLSLEQEIDLMIGGSPCQSFSTAGNRQGFSDPRGQAMLKYAELVRKVRPKMFLLENVKGLLSAALKHRPLNKRGESFQPLEQDEVQGSALSYLLKQFKGYNVNYKLINAADYGVPQTRERVFFIGVRKDLEEFYEFPANTHSSEENDGLPRWIDLGNVLNQMNVKKHHYPEYSPERLHYMKMIPKGGGNWKDLPEDVVEKAMGGAFLSGGGKVGFYRRLKIDKPAPTMLTSPIQKSTNLGHPFEDRPLSIEEYLAIQQFPEDYFVDGSLAQQYTQIGNAVPVGLAHILGNSIMETLQRINKTQLNLMVNEVAAAVVNG